MVKKFTELAKPILADPKRAARVHRYEEEALQQIVAFQLAELRQELGIDQTELARRLGMTQAGVSKLERSADPKLSTLRKLVEALGGTLVIQANINGQTVDLVPRSAA